MVILEADDIFTNKVLEHIRVITDTLTLTQGIATVMSLTNVMDIKGDEDGFQIAKLVDGFDLPDSPSELTELRNRIYEKGTYTGTLISEDGKATVIIFTLSKYADIKTVQDDQTKNRSTESA